MKTTEEESELYWKTRPRGSQLGAWASDQSRVILGRGGLEERFREMEEHYYNPKNTGLLDLGLKPHLLTDESLAGMIGYVQRHANRIRPQYILPQVRWK